MIFFNVKEARTQLLRDGVVYTLRPKLRRSGRDLAVYGSYFKNERLGSVMVSFKRKIESPDELTEYLPWSGFAKMEDWLAKAKGSVFLYEVRILAQ